VLEGPEALDDMGIEYEVARGPVMKGKREHMEAATGQRAYPAIEFEDGTWYREESKDMERRIREGQLGTTANPSG
jgi:hypothetical protein